MASSIVADASAIPNPQVQDPRGPIALQLRVEDVIHLQALLETGSASLPNCDDTDGCRAGVRAALDFMTANDLTFRQELLQPVAATHVTTTPEGSRIEIALSAADELEAIAGMMLRELRAAGPEQLQFRAAARRTFELAGLLSTALTDDGTSVDELQAVLSGLAGEAPNV